MSQKMTFQQECTNKAYYESLKYEAHCYDSYEKVEFIQAIAEHNLHLAALCVNSDEKNETLETELVRKAQKKAISFKESNQTEYAFLALLLLKKQELVQEIIQNLVHIKPIHRQVIQQLVRNADSDSILSFINLLFTEAKWELLALAMVSLADTIEWTQKDTKHWWRMFAYFVQLEEFDVVWLGKHDVNPILFSLYLKTNINKQHAVQRLLKLSKPTKINYFYTKLKTLGTKKVSVQFKNLVGDKLVENEVSYGIDINQATTFAAAYQAFTAMKTKGLVIDEISYNTLINKSDDFETANRFFQEMKTKGLVPNEISYSALLKHSRKFEKTQEIFEEMKQKGILLNDVVFNTMIDKAPRFREALDYYQQMLAARQVADKFTFSTLFKKMRSFKYAESLFRIALQHPLKNYDARMVEQLLTYTWPYQSAFVTYLQKIRPIHPTWQACLTDFYQLQVILQPNKLISCKVTGFKADNKTAHAKILGLTTTFLSSLRYQDLGEYTYTRTFEYHFEKGDIFEAYVKSIRGKYLSLTKRKPR